MSGKAKPCMMAGCDLPKYPGRHKCYWHHFAAQPIDVQVTASRRRARMTPPELALKRVPEWAWPPDFRWCAGCQSLVPTWYANGSQCRACKSAATHSAMIERTYGLTRAGYDELLALQDGRCAICRARPKTKRLAVDHDHKTNVVRGLLCSRCNHDLMGAAWDSLTMARALLGYIETPPATGGWIAPEDRATQRPVDASNSRPELLAAGDANASRSPRGASEAGECSRPHLMVLGGGKDERGYFKLYADENIADAPF